MFEAKVFRVVVASLSGTMEEVFAAKEAVRKWNLENAEKEGRVYLLVEESTKLENVDVFIGVVGNWIEKKVVVEGLINAGKKVMLFFNAFYDPNNTMSSEEHSVKEFKMEMKDVCMCKDYNGIADPGFNSGL